MNKLDLYSQKEPKKSVNILKAKKNQSNYNKRYLVLVDGKACYKSPITSVTFLMA